MKTKMFFAQTGEILATMEITMTMSQWLELQQQLDSTWPSWTLSARINDLINQASRQLWSEAEPKEKVGA